uniref:Uncharacterized protein n=2 Tax=Oryza glaberrima TaxID=4538 RepID=I1PY24_ORYGL
HAMADGDRGVAATAAAAAVVHEDVVESDEEDFTFAAASAAAAAVTCVVGGGRIGAVVYPVFGRPRSPPPVQEVEEPDTATVRVPLGQLLLEERASAPPSGEQADEDGVLDGVPAETYCLWSPGSPAPAVSNSPARCQKSGSTGSVLRWRQRLIGRSHSDGKEKFVFLSSGSDVRSKGRTTTTSSGDAGGRGGGWRYYASGGGNGGGRRPSFLPYKQDLVGLFANAGAFRRSYHPF